MNFTRKTPHKQPPLLLSSVDVSATFADDFFQNSSANFGENNAQYLPSSFPVHTPPSSPIRHGGSPYKTNNPSRGDEGRCTSEGSIQPSLSTSYSEPNSSPVTCLAAENTTAGQGTWDGDEQETQAVHPTAGAEQMPSNAHRHYDAAMKRPPCVYIVESPVYGRGMTEPYMEFDDEQRAGMEDMKRYRSSPSLPSSRGSFCQLQQTGRKCTRRQSRIRFWKRLPARKQNLANDQQTPHPSKFTARRRRSEIESDMSSLYVHDDDGRGEVKDDDESSRVETIDMCHDGKMHTATDDPIRFHSHSIEDHAHDRENLQNTGHQRTVETLSKARRRTSILGRLSERNPFARRSGTAPIGDGPEMKNDFNISRRPDPRSTRLRRGRSGRLMMLINKLCDRTPEGYSKAGVFDFNCDGQTALQEMKNLLERQYLAVLISEQFQELRMKVSLTTAGRFCVLSVIVGVEPQSGGNSRVYLRRGLGDILSVKSEDFDWLCFDIYRTLVKSRAVVRPYYS